MRNLFNVCLVLLMGLSLQAQTEIYRCGEMTTKGQPCKMRVKEMGLKCWHHSENGSVNGSLVSEGGNIVYTCGALTTKGKPCKRRVKIQGAKCYSHQK